MGHYSENNLDPVHRYADDTRRLSWLGVARSHHARLLEIALSILDTAVTPTNK
ncbi:MAG: hypothetical protein ACFB0G_08390 [Leptolyngbyaceae cyanobacterium]